MTKQRKRLWILGEIVFLALPPAVIFLPWKAATQLSDGCGCGREREYLEVSLVPSLDRRYYNMQIISPGKPNHRHSYWDAQTVWDGDVQRQFDISPWQEWKLTPCELYAQK